MFILDVIFDAATSECKMDLGGAKMLIFFGKMLLFSLLFCLYFCLLYLYYYYNLYFLFYLLIFFKGSLHKWT